MPENLIIIAVAVLFVAVAIYTFIRTRNIRKNGVETDAAISRIEEVRSTSYEGGADFSEIYYVTYTLPNGKTVEAKLDEAPANSQAGDSVRVVYLPDKPGFALLVK